MNNVTHLVIVCTLIAATLPIVASVLAALLPSSRVKSIDDYFLYARTLDLDSYLKTSVGYSLQVASIYLFFFWTITYGLYALLVPVAWGGGYVLLGRAVKGGRLDEFLSTTTADASTIHGFVWKKLGSGRSASVLWAVFVISVATVIGLGGTMLSEIDYSTKFLLKALDIGGASLPLEITIHLSVLGFTTLYVLWGGYQAVVNTDKIQVPFAYAAFG